MVCFDRTPDVAALIEKGIVEFSISIRLMHQAHTIFDTLRAYLLLGVQPPSDYMETPITILFDENTMDYVEARRRPLDGGRPVSL